MATTNLSDYNSSSIPNATGLRIGIVVSEWNEDITENLYQGAKETLLKHQVVKENITRLNVPGSFELIFGCKHLLEKNKFDALIAIGCVIQGETKHFDFVCEAVSQGIMKLNVNFSVPTIFCVLTDNTKQQSLDRSGGNFGNKGVEAAVTALKMASLL